MYRSFIKRVFDILLAVILMPIVLLLILMICPIIYITDKGKVFYNAPRLGKNGKVFRMYKFRSMKVNSPDLRNEDGSTYNSENDPRLTKIGKILRKTSLDELPQIINVIKGDMSFIGPRPDLPEHLEQYNASEMQKLQIRPGITGYNQAYFRNGIPWKDRLKNDVFYVNNISFLFDVKILFKTVHVIFRRKNIYSEGKS
ncbi:MAG: sugar transferase [Bacilli bacterium]|nr:sugar transferase [Bacilli bacterium]